MSSPVVEFFFELGSPYSYFAATQLHAIEQRTGATFVWKPMVLGAVFKATSNEMPSTVPTKARYMFQDLKRWSAHYGEPFEWPATFPLNTIYVHRAILAVEREHGQARARALTLALYRAYWGEGHDITQPAEMTAVFEAQGFDAQHVSVWMQDQEIKDLLKHHTEHAIECGVFGAPSFVVDDELFWGNDRLDFLESHLARAQEP